NLMPNALYWKGETYYAQKNYPQAILTFKDVTQRYPRHAKAQDALLKIGMSYKNSGDTDNAVLYLRTLVDEHPNASASALARKILQELPE
ncbi:MAG: tetratricopeptide repeat protein, partial [Proteobacteria bacterium]|nr:tetratricopeptide repeat protein [Pseudomonadota bacterium]